MFETVFLSAIALVLIIEGILPFAFPDLWRKTMLEMVQLNNRKLRLVGLFSIALGMILLFVFS